MRRIYPNHYYDHPDFKAWIRKRNNARRRGIGFELTIEQWWKLWKQSGHLKDRGRGANKFCMARFGDRGPYAVGNVKIVTNRENWAEEWRLQSDEEREERSQQMKQYWRSGKRRDAQRQAVSASWATRREKYGPSGGMADRGRK